MNCEIIKDLLPLHIENLSSEASNQLILEHINNCEDCRETLEKLKTDIKVGGKGEEDETVEAIPENLIKRIKKNIFSKVIASVLVTLILGIIIGLRIFTSRTPMFIAFLCLVSICSFAAAIFISIAISIKKPTLRKRFKSLGNWTFVFSIIFSFLFFAIFNGYFFGTGNMPPIIFLVIVYNVILSITLRIYARFRLPKLEVSGEKNVTNKKLFIVAFSTLFAIFALFIVPVTLIEKNRIIDNIDLPFVTDNAVLGTWTTVAFVKSPEQFNPDELPKEKQLFVKEMTFRENGYVNEKFSYKRNNQTETPWLSWTKNFVIDKGGDHVTCKYEIREIKGSKYIFVEWKSGDYSYFHRSPYFYVFKYEGSAK
jgi:hypothetical protein